MKQSALIGTLKLVAASSGPACILYGIHLFERYFELGTVSADAAHTVLVNNHGVYRYITESQDRDFRVLLGLGAALLAGLFVSIVISHVKRRRARGAAV